MEHPEEVPQAYPQGGGLLAAAFGVTKAVTQFLGAALQVSTFFSHLIFRSQLQNCLLFFLCYSLLHGKETRTLKLNCMSHTN